MNIKEADLAIKYGCSAVGLVSKMPSGPGVISDSEIIKIVSHIPPAVSSFLLTSKQESESIIEQAKKINPNVIQLCDYLKNGSYKKLKEKLSHIKLVQVIHVNDPSSLIEAIKISKNVDALLLDSGNKTLPIKQLGGTGKTHDWNLSKLICRSVKIPVFLAGGLNYKNVQSAIKTVNPFAVDVCSGVRTNGKLDEKKLADFVDAVKSSYE